MKRHTVSLIVFGLMLALMPAPALAQTNKPSARGTRKGKAAARPVVRSVRLIAGEPLIEPKVIQSQGGVLETTLQLKNRLAGRVIETGTYNGDIPGPTLRVKPGDTGDEGLRNLIAACNFGEDNRRVRTPRVTKKEGKLDCLPSSTELSGPRSS